MPVYKTNALVLRRISLGETDKILTLFSREYGKFSAIAKGARRTTSRLAGGTEPLLFVRLLLAEGMNLDVVTQVEVRDSFQTLKGDFGLYLRATYACELLDKLTAERDPSSAAFDVLLSALYVLQRAADPDAALHAYELQLMGLIGYEPRLDACVRCERTWGEGVLPSGYSAPRGGALCGDCNTSVKEETLPISGETVLALARLASLDDARALAQTQLTSEVRDQMNRVLRAHLRYRLERDVRSTAFLDAFRIGAMDELSDAPLPPVSV